MTIDGYLTVISGCFVATAAYSLPSLQYLSHAGFRFLLPGFLYSFYEFHPGKAFAFSKALLEFPLREFFFVVHSHFRIDAILTFVFFEDNEKYSNSFCCNRNYVSPDGADNYIIISAICFKDVKYGRHRITETERYEYRKGILRFSDFNHTTERIVKRFLKPLERPDI